MDCSLQGITKKCFSLPLFLGLAGVITSCWNETVIEAYGIRSIRNDSDYTVEVTLASTTDTLRADLAPGDSVYSDGVCRWGFSRDCTLGWDEQGLYSAIFWFGDDLFLDFTDQQVFDLNLDRPGCQPGELNTPEECGYVSYFNASSPDTIVWAYPITNHHYEAAETMAGG